MKILVTGGAGFIGSHCVDRLLERGDNVVCVDNFDDLLYSPEVKRSNISEHLKSPNYTLFEADIADKEKIFNLFKEEKFDKVLHLAARASVPVSVKYPIKCAEANYLGTAILLEARKRFNVNHFIFASSSSVYGTNTKVPFSEDDNTDSPKAPYPASKKACEALAAAYHNNCGLHIAGLRFFTVYGPRNRPDMAIAKFTKLLLDNKPITVFDEPNHVKRDWTFIEDIVTGVIKVLDSSEKWGFEVFNLGNQKPEPVDLLVSLLEKEFDKKAIIQRAPLPPADVPITFADTSKMKRLLDWQPTTPLEVGVKKFVEWFKQQN